jgi:hypothetical protein
MNSPKRDIFDSFRGVLCGEGLLNSPDHAGFRDVLRAGHYHTSMAAVTPASDEVT